MGYCGPGALSRDHVRVLPRRCGRPSRVRHSEASVLRERGAVAARAARPRRPKYSDYARWQQE